jgi:ABC-2 type transport system permease protein
MMPLIQFAAVATKEFRQIAADTRMLAVLVVVPIIQLFIFGFAMDFDVDRIPTVIVDQDHTAASRSLAEGMLADGSLLGVGEIDDPRLAMDAMDAGVAAAVVVIPQDLDRSLRRGRPAQVQVLVDGSDPNRSGVAASASARYLAEEGLRPWIAKGFGPAVRVVPRVLYNPSLETAPYLVPGISAMLLVVTTTLVTAMGLARERETGTLEQVLVTPISSSVLLSGKVTPYLLIGLFDVALALGVGAWVFGVPFRGPLAVLVVATCLYVLSTLGVGLLLAAVSSSQQQAFMGGFLFMIPAILLAGNMTPVSSMPEWLQPVTALNPLRWYIAVVRANLIEGAGFADVAGSLGALALIGSALIVTAVWRFRTRLA